LEKDESDIQLDRVEVGNVIDDIFPIVSQSAKQKRISMVMDVNRDIEFTADEEKVKQILINLLTNAISYTPENGEVSVTITEDSEHVSLQVKDSGIGISKEALPRIFERFYRVDKHRSRDTGGTGLGL